MLKLYDLSPVYSVVIGVVLVVLLSLLSLRFIFFSMCNLLPTLGDMAYDVCQY